MGVAASMAVLEADDLAHGPIEALFTIDEETGMTGAENLKPGLLQGDILLNLDSEDEGELYIGCAGGVDTTATMDYTEEATPEGMTGFTVAVKGLKGGHSGLDINLGRGNANKIMNALLMTAAEKFGLRVSELQGGSLRNAIPRESFATVVVPADKVDDFNKFVEEFTVIAKDEFKEADPGLEVVVEAAPETPAKVMDAASQAKLFKAIAEAPNGVIAMSESVEGIVETSTNLAIVNVKDGKVDVASLQRSLVDSDRDKIGEQMKKVFLDNGFKATNEGAYPGWKPNPDSVVLKEMKEIYNKKYGKVVKILELLSDISY